MREELKIDPDDDCLYTRDELFDKYWAFPLEVVSEYWAEDCKPRDAEADASRAELQSQDFTCVVVGGLDWRVTSEDLKQVATKWGRVASLERHPDRGHSSPSTFAVVSYERPEAAARAVAGFQEASLSVGGLTASNLTARPLWDSRRGLSVFVCGLNRRTTLEELLASFRVCGEIRAAELLAHADTREPKGQAWIQFVFPDSVCKAVETLHLAELGGRRIAVTEWKEDAKGMRIPGPMVFLRGLSRDTLSSTLRNILDDAGAIVVEAWVPKSARRPKCDGRVELGDEVSAQLCIARLGGLEVDGSTIEAKPFRHECRRSPTGRSLGRHTQPEPLLRPPHPHASSPPPPPPPPPSTSSRQKRRELAAGYAVFVSNLAFGVTSEVLWAFFEPAGTVLDAIVFAKAAGRSSFGKVVFESEAGVRQALEGGWCGAELGGRRIQVRRYRVEHSPQGLRQLAGESAASVRTWRGGTAGAGPRAEPATAGRPRSRERRAKGKSSGSSARRDRSEATGEPEQDPSLEACRTWVKSPAGGSSARGQDLQNPHGHDDAANVITTDSDEAVD